MKKNFKFIDLFAGIGGIRIPFEELGGECVFSSEWDKFSQQTYEANFGEIPHGDITEIDEKDIPKHDLLVGGFPCQAFSQAGLKKGFKDTRGTMFFEIQRILDHHKPKALLLENVKGLRGHDKGKTFKVIISILNELGYQTLESKVLNANQENNLETSGEMSELIFSSTVGLSMFINSTEIKQVSNYNNPLRVFIKSNPSSISIERFKPLP